MNFLKKFALVLFFVLVLGVQCSESKEVRPAKKVINPTELSALTQVIFMEARNQGNHGKYAVGIVVLTRVKSGKYPTTVQKVVFQSKKKGIYQFSYLNNPRTRQKALERKLRDIDPVSYDHCKEVAKTLLIASDDLILFIEKTLDIHGATHYHTTQVKPHWSKKLKKLTRINDHVFYKE